MLPRLVLYSWAQVIFRRALCSQVSRNMPQCPLVSLLKAPFSESRLGFTLPFNIVSISFHSLHICMVSEKFNVITPVFAPEEIRLFIYFILCLSRWVFFFFNFLKFKYTRCSFCYCWCFFIHYHSFPFLSRMRCSGERNSGKEAIHVCRCVHIGSKYSEAIWSMSYDHTVLPSLCSHTPHCS